LWCENFLKGKENHGCNKDWVEEYFGRGKSSRLLYEKGRNPGVRMKYSWRARRGIGSRRHQEKDERVPKAWPPEVIYRRNEGAG